jgi:hypothetical protein
VEEHLRQRRQLLHRFLRFSNRHVKRLPDSRHCEPTKRDKHRIYPKNRHARKLVWNRTYTYSGYASAIESISGGANGNLMFLGTATKETVYGEFDANSRTHTWVAEITSSGQIQEQLLFRWETTKPSRHHLSKSLMEGMFLSACGTRHQRFLTRSFGLQKFQNHSCPLRLNRTLSFLFLHWTGQSW